MNQYVCITISAAFLIFLIFPILISRFTTQKTRIVQSVRLEDTSYQEISFLNPAQDITLAGMLFVPEGNGPFPAAVIIHGSGTSRRDNGWYLTLTHYLQENGIVVLLPDKRGSEISQGDWRKASFEDLATDTLAAISFLNDQEQIPITTIGIVGLSQGGHIAPLVASESSDVAFLVNIVGACLPMHELLVYEETHNLREMGFLPGISNILAYPSSWMIRNISQKEFWNAIGNFDPLPYWERITTSSLVLHGEKDTNVPSAMSAARLRSLEKPNIAIKIYAGSGHALEDPEGIGNSIFREDALRDIREFIASTSIHP